MKNKLLSFGLAGLTTALMSFTFVQKSDEAQEPKKTRHIKMIKTENGKKMELDTVFTNDDVFVWNGDTVNPIKHMKKVNPSGFDKMEKFDVKVDRKDGNEKVMIIKHKDGKDGDENQVFYFNDGNMKHFPPVPPVPPVPPMPHMRMMKMQHSGQIINLNDPDIISFKKKDLSGDREKIEIIRKKSNAPEDMTFDFDFDNQLAPPPPPPPAPEMIREYENENQKMKIMEKEININGKKGKEIKVEIENEENK